MTLQSDFSSGSERNVKLKQSVMKRAEDTS